MKAVMNELITALNGVGQSFWDYSAALFVQSGVLILLLVLFDLLLRKRVRAVVRYCLWMLVFVKLVLPTSFASPTGIGYWLGDYFAREPAVSQPMPDFQPASPMAELRMQAAPIRPEVAASQPPVNETPPVRQATLPAGINVESPTLALEPVCWQGFVFLGWLAGMLVLLVLLIQRAWFVKGLLAQANEPDAKLSDLLSRCRAQVAVKNTVTLKLSTNVISPAVCGLFEPTILLPEHLVDKLNDEQLQAILIHELAHIRRGDLWVNLVQTLLQIVYFYNPFVWLANAMVRRVREQAVDEMVLVTMGGRSESYSNTLIDIGEMAFWRPNLSLRLIGVVESKRALTARIKHIVGRPMPKTAKLGMLGLISVAVIGAILLPMARGQRPSLTEPDNPAKQAGQGQEEITGAELMEDSMILDGIMPVIELAMQGRLGEHPRAIARLVGEPGPGILRGIVRDAADTSDHLLSLNFVPVERWPGQPLFYYLVQANEDFELTGIPPGSYYLLAIEAVNPRNIDSVGLPVDWPRPVDIRSDGEPAEVEIEVSIWLSKQARFWNMQGFLKGLGHLNAENVVTEPLGPYGRVTDWRGRALPYATVQVRVFESDQEQERVVAAPDARTNQEGYYGIGPEDRPYFVGAIAHEPLKDIPGYRWQYLRRNKFFTGKEQIDFQFGPWPAEGRTGGTIAGTVVDDNGRPIPSFTVDVRTAAPWVKLHEANEPWYKRWGLRAAFGEGKFVIDDLPAGECNIRIVSHQSSSGGGGDLAETTTTVASGQRVDVELQVKDRQNKRGRRPVFGYRSPLGVRKSQSGTGKPASELKKPASELKVGDEAPPFETQTLAGQRWALANYRGKVVLLCFWVAGSQPSESQLPYFKSAYEAFREDEQFAMIGLVHKTRRVKDLEEYLGNYGLHWAHVVLDSDDDRVLAQQYGVQRWPSAILIGQDGKVIARNLRGNAIKWAVERALKAVKSQSKAERPYDNTAHPDPGAAKTVGGWSEPVKLGPAINTEYDESYPYLSADGTSLYFNSNRPGGFGGADIYVSRKVDGVWQEPENLGSVVNSSHNEAGPMLSHDGKYLFFWSDRTSSPSTMIFVSRIVDGEFHAPQPLPYSINSAVHTDEPFLTADGKMLYFQTCKRSGNINKRDLWCSDFDEGVFQMPVNLGPVINQYPRQKSPSLTADGRLLYYIYEQNDKSTGIVVSQKEGQGFSNPVEIDFPSLAEFRNVVPPASQRFRRMEGTDVKWLSKPGESDPGYPQGYIDSAKISWDGSTLYFSMKDTNYDIWYAGKDQVGQTRRTRQRTPESGLVAHWKFDEGEGATAYDSVGDNHGTIHGARWTPAAALRFDGVDDYVEIQDSDVFDFGTADFSICVWFKTSDPTIQHIVNFRQDDNDPHIELYTATPNFGKIGTNLTSAPVDVRIGNNEVQVSDNTWHHAAITLDNGAPGGYKLYLDGKRVGESGFSGRLRDWNSIRIGHGEGPGAGRFFSGFLDEVAIYNRALSAEEIRRLCSTTGKAEERSSTPAALRSLGVEVEGKNGKYHIVTDSEEDAGLGEVLFSDGTRLRGQVFLWNLHDEQTQIERLGDQLKITYRDGRTSNQTINTNRRYEVFIRTPQGWKPRMGERWAPITSEFLNRTHVKKIVFGRRPTASQRQEFRRYWDQWHKDRSQRQWQAHWAQRSKEPPGSWEKWSSAKQRCYQNLVMIRWAGGAYMQGEADLTYVFEHRHLPVPTCRMGGRYVAGSAGGWVRPECSTHGSLTDLNPEMDPPCLSDGNQKRLCRACHATSNRPSDIGMVALSDGTRVTGAVFVQGGDDEWARMERIGQELKITYRDGRTRTQSVYTKDPSLEEVFVKTADGWKPALGETWPSLDSSSLDFTYVKEIVFGEKPTESEKRGFREYRHKYHKDLSERQWQAHWAKLSKNLPPPWERRPSPIRQCYRNLAMIRWASGLDWNSYLPVGEEHSLEQLFGWRTLDQPVCPAGGEYSAGSGGTWVQPRCTVHGALADFKPEMTASGQRTATKVEGRLGFVLECQLSPARSTYVQGEDVIIQLELRNLSAKTFTLNTDPHPKGTKITGGHLRGVKLLAKDEAGNVMRDHEFWYPIYFSDHEYEAGTVPMTLAPGAALIHKMTAYKKGGEICAFDLSRPGKYTIWAEINLAWAMKDTGIKGNIASAPIKVQIKGQAVQDRRGDQPRPPAAGAASPGESYVRVRNVAEGTMPQEVQEVLDEYLRCVEDGDVKAAKRILCFADKRDEELFWLFGGLHYTGGKMRIGRQIVPGGQAAGCKRASEDCWMFVLEDGHLVELWKVDDNWRVLCPVPGRLVMGQGKLAKVELHRHLVHEEIKRVQSESDAQLLRRRARYVAVLELSLQHPVKRTAYYYGIPNKATVEVAGMSAEEFRDAVVLKLDAPYGLRYRAESKAGSFLESEPVAVTFSVENVTDKSVKLRYRPGVQVINGSDAFTARGALVSPKGHDLGRSKNPYTAELDYPLKEQAVTIGPRETFITELNLLDYYDLPPARYTIFSRIDGAKDSEANYWRGRAMADTKSFQILGADSKPRDPVRKSLDLAAKAEEILTRLYAAMEKAYADVGLSKEDIQGLLLVQRPPQKAMGKWKAYQEAWPAIVKARDAAIAEMASLGPEAVAILLRAKDESGERRGADIFVLAITKIGGPAVPAAIDGLSHADPAVRARAATALGKIRDGRAVEPLIGALNDSDAAVLRAAVWSLGMLADRRAVEPLLNLWGKQTIGKSDLAWALGHIGDKRAAEPIIAALAECVSQAEQKGNWDTNSWAMRVYAGALGQIGDSRAIPVLKRALQAGPQRTKAGPPKYLVAEAVARALRSLGLKVEAQEKEGDYQIIGVAPPAEMISGATADPENLRRQRDYAAAANVPQPMELWKVGEYGCGGNPRTWKQLQTDAKRQYPILLTWPLIQGAAKYVVQMKGVRGSRPTKSFECRTNSLRLEEVDLAPGRYQWSVSVYDRHGMHMGDVETIDPVELFAIEEPRPAAACGKKGMIDLNHSAGHIKGWGFYNHSQYMTKELLENAGFEVQVNERDLLTAERLKSVDLLICHYYWAGWPGFRPFLESELVAIRQFVERGGSLLVIGCDGKDGGGKMCEAGNQLVEEFGLAFELDGISEEDRWAQVASDQNVISVAERIPMQLPVSVRGHGTDSLLHFGGLPIVRTKQFGKGRIIAAGVGMSFLDCYLGDFEHREPLHLITFYDFIRYLTDIDWKKNCNKEFVDAILARCHL
ncbi:MAG: M56 family metallopeptidase [Planctomycetota bacterium]|jgi:beta-lactamase regulating signal transducer with metallopeptidase domain/peroxiredoxin